MAKILFFCHDSLNNIEEMEYYRQDLDALRALGHQVVVCNRYRDMYMRFDAIYVWWWTYALFPVLLAKVLRKKAIVTGVFNFRIPNREIGGDYFSRPFWQRALIRGALRLADLNLFISLKETSQCREFFGVRTLVHYPCSVGREYLQTVPSSLLPSLLNISWSGHGNLKRKGVFDLIQAVELLKAEGVCVRLTLVGKKGDGFEHLKSLILQKGLTAQVDIVGEVSKARKLELLASHHIYVQPSYYEGFGLATAEAMASGAYIITCDVGEVKQVVGDCAVFVTPGDTKELAAAIKHALQDASHRVEMQNRARAHARRNFCFERKLENLSTALESLSLSGRTDLTQVTSGR